MTARARRLGWDRRVTRTEATKGTRIKILAKMEERMLKDMEGGKVSEKGALSRRKGKNGKKVGMKKTAGVERVG